MNIRKHGETCLLGSTLFDLPSKRRAVSTTFTLRLVICSRLLCAIQHLPWMTSRGGGGWTDGFALLFVFVCSDI